MSFPVQLGELKDPRIIASGIAIGLMLLDDLPRPNYGTGHDPGAATMLSLILANAIALMVHRGVRGWICDAVLLPALFLKPYVQMFFWVRNATVIDLVVLLASHALLGFMSSGTSSAGRPRGAVAGFAGTGLALLLAGLLGLYGKSWLVFWWQVAAVRILVPVLFWTAVLRASRGSAATSPSTDHPR